MKSKKELNYYSKGFADGVKYTAEELIKRFDEYFSDIKNCEYIKKINYKSDIDFQILLFKIIARKIINNFVEE